MLACTSCPEKHVHVVMHSKSYLLTLLLSFKGLLSYVHVHRGLRPTCTWTCPLIECIYSTIEQCHACQLSHMDCQEPPGTTQQLTPINIIHKGQQSIHVFRNKQS